MEKIITSIQDPLQFTETFKSLIHSQITAHSSEGSPCKVSLSFINQHLSLIKGSYFNFSGVWEPVGCLSMCIPISDRGFSLNGTPIDDKKYPLTVTVTRPGQQSFFSFPLPYKSLVLFVDYNTYKSHFESLNQMRFEDANKSHFLKFKSFQTKRDFLDKLAPFVNNSYPYGFSLLELDHIVSSLIENFILSLEPESCNLDRNYCNALAVKVYAFIISNKVEQISLALLCKEMNASARSIQKGFNDLYGMGPIDFDRIYRIHRLRAHIKKHGLAHGELTNLIGIFGFNHAGRFSQSYKEMFGVSPSKDHT